MSDSVRPHRQQPARLPRPWDSPGKNTGVRVAISFSKVGCIMALKDIRSSLGNVTFSQLSYLSCLVVSDSLQPQGLQHTRLSCPSPTPRACSNSCPLSWWCQPSHPLSFSFPSVFNLSQHQGLFKWVGSSEVLELQHQSFQWMFRIDFL